MDEPLEIPKFDLAEQIMAEQRKLAAMRRKGPVRKPSAASAKREMAASVPVASAPEPARLSSQVEKIIEEIVARDIRQLCGGSVSVF